LREIGEIAVRNSKRKEASKRREGTGDKRNLKAGSSAIRVVSTHSCLS